MRELKMKLFALTLPLVVSACGSTPPVRSVREAPTTSGVDNATGPQLADTVTRDYFTLRERLMTMHKQLEGAQDYIRTQCLK
ncbi:hypothetical protein ECZU03_45010 [Escherichia coli]|nr:hypothetical protein ECZU03_45010 [Escherichia coli]